MIKSPIDISFLREVFDSFDQHQKGVIEMWRMRELLNACNLAPSDVALFNLISDIDENGDGMLSFQEYLYLVQKLKENSSVKDSDMELLNSWIQCGGNASKDGFVKISNIKQYIKKYHFSINLDAIVYSLVQKKNALSISTKKAVVPEDIDFEDFRVIFNENL